MATSTEAVMIELEKEGCQWIKSEQFLKKQKLIQKEKEENNPLKNCVLKYDHFEHIHRLPKDAPVYPGAPNFRQTPGYLVCGTGQPTMEGFENCLKYIHNELGKKILWINMRQEPVVYMNGQSFTPRMPDQLNENMEFPTMTGEDIEWLQEEFVKIVYKRIAESKSNRRIKKEDQGKRGVRFNPGQMESNSCCCSKFYSIPTTTNPLFIVRTDKIRKTVPYFRDTYAEHPEDRENIEYLVHLDSSDSLCTLSQIYEKQKNFGFDLNYARLPIVDEKAPTEDDFDNILQVLRLHDKDTVCVFNCQMGKGRTTTGMILACLVKDVLYGDAKKNYPKPSKLNPKDFEDEDEYLEEVAKKGQFEMLEDLFQYVPEAVEAKDHLDHIIDVCGVTPKGTGLQNLRECIIWTKEKFDFEPKIKKPFWKRMSLNFIERYFYLICFTTYLRSEAPHGFEKSFVLWMDIRAEIREILYRGLQKFDWK